jgi:hypothetical protein
MMQLTQPGGRCTFKQSMILDYIIPQPLPELLFRRVVQAVFDVRVFFDPELSVVLEGVENIFAHVRVENLDRFAEFCVYVWS